MTEPLPEIILGISADEGIAVFGKEAFTDLASLLARLPALREPANAAVLARAVNNFARKSGYSVIEDVDAFQAAYKAKMALEDPSTPWRQGNYNLRDYGVPDFATLRPPTISGGTISFFAADAMIGLPYSVTAPLEGDTATTYTPMPLTPVAPPHPVTDAPEDEELSLEPENRDFDENADDNPLAPAAPSPFDDK